MKQTNRDRKGADQTTNRDRKGADQTTNRDRKGADQTTNRDRKGADQHSLTYLLTWPCYGAWLPGEARGSVDRAHNVLGEPLLPPDARRYRTAVERMEQLPYVLDEARRAVVLAAVRGVCDYRGWYLHAVHVRSNHVHVVVTANVKPERVLNDLKAYASRRLNEAQYDGPERKRWARHGSTRYLATEVAVVGAVDYVLRGQGEPMASFPGPDV